MSITITKEIDLEFYETHPDGQAILDRIINEGEVNEFEAILTDLYPEGIRESELDDMLRFEEDDICKWLDLRSEEQGQGRHHRYRGRDSIHERCY